jgi:hypothetical protein
VRRALDRVATALLVAMILAAAGMAATVSRNKSFQVDEVEHIHAAYHMQEGRLIYSEFWQVHNPLLYGFLSPLIDTEDPVGSFQSARLFMLLVTFGCVGLSGFCAYRLAGSGAGRRGNRADDDGNSGARADSEEARPGRWAAVATMGLLLVHSTYVERAIEVRPDGPLVLCTLVALALELSKLPRARRYMYQAAALSAAFLFTQKAAFVCFAFGCLWLVFALRERRIKLVALPMLVWTTPFALMLGVFALLGNFDEYVRYCLSFASEQVVDSEVATEALSPWGHVMHEASRNQFTTALVVVGLVFSIVMGGRAVLARARASGDAKAAAEDHLRLFFPGLLGLVLVLSLELNPFPFPYLHVTVLPVLVILGAVFLVRAPIEFGRGTHRIAAPATAIVAVLLASISAIPRLLLKAENDVDYQFEMLEELDRVADPDDKVFDMVGLYFREDGYPVPTMTGAVMAKYKAGVYPDMIPKLRQNESIATMLNYRSVWLPPREAAFMGEHYVHYTGNLFLMGTGISNLEPGMQRPFEVLKEKTFRWEGTAPIQIDGQPFEQGTLAKGVHVISATQTVARGRLIMDTPKPYPKREPPRALYKNFD